MGVQIQGDTGNVIATKGTYSGNVTIGGTLTYEDVTNIDSVGLVTARTGIEIGARPGVAASISVDGNMIVSGITTIGGDIKVGSGVTLSPDGDVFATGVCTATSFSGSGANLTGIDVGLSTASAQVSGITTVIDLSKDDIRIDCTGNVTVDTRGGSEGASHTLRIVNSGISTVSFNSYFKFPSGGTPNLPTANGAISLISFTVHTQGRVGVASVFLAGSSVNFS
jgi:hypothetical protein|tara:strand:- start:12 stop:683 length:672 start_codon:yes stop_codon:yes gene_type:complete